MSDLMLHGVLNMPLPDDPAECDLVTWFQFKDRARQASSRITALEAENAALKRFVAGMAMCALAEEHDAEERAALLGRDEVLHQRDEDITQARTILAKLEKEATK